MKAGVLEAPHASSGAEGAAATDARSTAAPSRRGVALVPYLLLIVLVLVVHADPVFTGRVFFYRDLGMIARPTLAEAFAGHAAEWFPFSTDSLSSGRALLANPGYEILAPLGIVYRLFPFDTAFDLFLVLHVALAGCAMLRLARRLGCSRTAAFAAGAAYALGGGILSALTLYCTVVPLAWAPLVISAAIGAGRAPGARGTAIWALAIGVLALGGQPEPIAATLLIATIAAFAAASGAVAARVKRCAPTAIVALLGGFAIAAPQLIPAALHARTTLRHLGFTVEGLFFNSLHPLRALWLVVPGLGGNPVHADVPGAFPGAKLLDSQTPYLLSIYLGIVTVILAIAGIALAERRLRGVAWVFAGAALLGVVLALGRHLPGAVAIVKALPFSVPFRYPEKALFLTFLAIPPLAALGIDALARLRVPKLPLLAAAAVVLDLALAQRGYTPTIAAADLAAPPLAQQLIARSRALGIPDGAWRIHHERQRASGGWGPPKGSLPPTEEDFHRWQTRMLVPPTAAPFGIGAAMELEGDHLEDARYIALTRAAYTGPPHALPLALGEAAVLWVVSPRDDLDAATGGLLVREIALGTDQGVPPGSGFVYRNTRFVPRARITGDFTPLAPLALRDAAASAVRRYADASTTWPPATAIEVAGGTPVLDVTNADAGRVEQLHADHRGLTLLVSADRAALVTVADVAGDLRAWTARVDGRSVPLWRANLAYLALPVEAGHHEIRLDYRPRGLNAGIALMLAALAGVALAILPRAARGGLARGQAPR